MASQLLTNSNVKSAIELRQAKAREKAELTEADVWRAIEWGLEQARSRGNLAAHVRYLSIVAKILGMEREQDAPPQMPQIVINMPEAPPERRRAIDSIQVTENDCRALDSVSACK